MDASACYNSDDESCIMFLAFCHSVPSEIGETCSGSAICQKGRSDNGLVLELSMGRFTNFTHFYESKSTLKMRRIWMDILWRGGRRGRGGGGGGEEEGEGEARVWV